MLRYREIPTRTTDLLDLTSLTVDEFTALVPPFEAACLDAMADWTLHGRRRQSRRYTTDKNCPLPTPEDRLLFIGCRPETDTSSVRVYAAIGTGISSLRWPRLRTPSTVTRKCAAQSAHAADQRWLC